MKRQHPLHTLTVLVLLVLVCTGILSINREAVELKLGSPAGPTPRENDLQASHVPGDRITTSA
jgi:hypothetical protein